MVKESVHQFWQHDGHGQEWFQRSKDGKNKKTKNILHWIKEIVGDKDPDPVHLDQSFKKIYCEGGKRNMMVEEVEFGSM